MYVKRCAIIKNIIAVCSFVNNLRVAVWICLTQQHRLNYSVWKDCCIESQNLWYHWDLTILSRQKIIYVKNRNLIDRATNFTLVSKQHVKATLLIFKHLQVQKHKSLSQDHKKSYYFTTETRQRVYCNRTYKRWWQRENRKAEGCKNKSVGNSSASVQKYFPQHIV